MRNMKIGLLFLPLMLLGSHVQAKAEDGIGLVLLTSGDVKAKAKSGTERSLARKSPLFAGDTISVGKEARAQIRFSDASLMTLDSGSEFRVDTYKHDGNGDDKFVGTLVKGGFRTLTGAIGKGGKDNYSISTPVAVMGVRGSGLECGFVEGQLAVGIWEGRGWVENEHGLIELGDNERFNFAMVDEDSEPVGLLDEPEVLEGLDVVEGFEIANLDSLEDVEALEATEEELQELEDELISELTEDELLEIESEIAEYETFPDDADEEIFEDPQSDFDSDDVFEDEFFEEEPDDSEEEL